MKFLLVTLLLLFCLMVIPESNVLAQPYIDLRLFDSQARVFYVGDLDPTGLGNAPAYYSLEIGNTGSTPATVRILFSVLGNNTVFVEGRSNIFNLPAQSAFIFSSSQLNTGVAMIGDQEIKIGDYNIDFGSIQDLERKVAATGKLPAGRYEFRVELRYEPAVNPNVPDQNPDDNILIITNPTTIEPLTPGSRVSNEDMSEIPSITPYFVWQSDAEFFDLYVFRKYEADNIQDVLSRDPILHLENFPGQIFQYPSETEPLIFFGPNGTPIGKSIGAVRLIEPGQIYYWYVAARIPGASGEILLPSDVFQFKVSNREGAAMASSQILTYLRQLLGERYDDAMDPLQGFNPTGTLLVNGYPMTMEELEDLVRQYSAGKFTLQDVYVQE